MGVTILSASDALSFCLRSNGSPQTSSLDLSGDDTYPAGEGRREPGRRQGGESTRDPTCPPRGRSSPRAPGRVGTDLKLPRGR